MVEVKRDKKSGGIIITKFINTEAGLYHQQLTLTEDDMKSAYKQFLKL